MECFQSDEKARQRRQHARMIRTEESSNRRIEREIFDVRRDQVNHMKLLLLGTGDSGKSTLLKQMKVLFMDGYSIHELEHFRFVLRDNCLTSMKRICAAMPKFGISVLKAHRPLLAEIVEATELTPSVGKALKTLWKEDSAIREVLVHSFELELPGGGASIVYFFENAKRFSDVDYLPSKEDVIRCKIKTTGILEYQFDHNAIHYTVVDVGGQRSERRKWIHSFSDVTAVLYVAALDEYDMVLEEDNSTNRMTESLQLFASITSSEYFESTSFIVLLNKSDIFETKIKARPLKDFFEDYETVVETERRLGADLAENQDYLDGIRYIKSKYVEAFRGNRMYPHVTCAIDTDLVKKVVASIRDSVISGAMIGAGLK